MRDKKKREGNKNKLLTTAKAVAMISSLSTGLTVFENFAVAAMWNDTQWANFVNSTRTLEKSKTQTLITNTHNQHTQHTNYTSPHQNSGGNHNNSGGNHSEYISPHYNVSASHSNSTSPHTNYTSPHSNVVARHSNSTSPHTDYTSPHSNVAGRHSNSTSPHSNVAGRHTNSTSPHSNNYTPHSNSTSPHYNYAPHSNSSSPHTDYVSYWGGRHTNSGGHRNSTGVHRDYGGTHSNSSARHSNSGGAHTDYYTAGRSSGGVHTDTYTPGSSSGGNHTDTGGVHTDNYSPGSSSGGTHTDSGGYHTDNYSPGSSSGGTHSHYVSPHTDYTNPHSNATPHSNASPHVNTGFDHQNYIPSRPAFFNVAQDQQLVGNAKIGMYSYDKNYDNVGSIDANSKTTRYDLYIRRVKNLDGSANVSAWRTLVNDQPSMTPDGGYVYTLNTIDPLGVGNTNFKTYEGYYEIRALSRNSPINGVTYQSPEQLITVKVQQNQDPQVTVTNATEFINFTFGFDGALNQSNIYKRYTDGLYSGVAANQKDGILVRVSMKDTDTALNTQQNWQKGKMYLKNAGGTTISTVDIMWDNGTATNTADDTITTSSEGVNKTGYGFFPKASYTAAGDMTGAKVVVELSDYLDAACTVPAGATISQGTVSGTDTTLLVLNIDVTAPTVAADNTDYTWKKVNSAVSLTYTAADIKQYQITQSTSQPTTGWQNYTGAITVSAEGLNYVWYRAADNTNNEKIGYFGPYRIDKTIPTGSIAVSTGATNAGSVNLVLSGNDNLSGVNEMIISNNNTFSGASWEAYGTAKNNWALPAGDGSKTIYVKYRDTAGNESAVTSRTVLLDTTAPTGTVTINSGASVTYSQTVSLEILGDDGAGSGVTEIAVSENPSPTTWESYSNRYKDFTLSAGEGNKTIYVKFKDAVGNVSSAFTASIKYVAPIYFFDSVEHHQIIKVGTKDVAVTSPTTLASGETLPAGQALVDWNKFIDGDYVRYRMVLNINDASKVKQIQDMQIELHLNDTTEDGVGLNIEKIELQKKNGSNYTVLKNLNTPQTLIKLNSSGVNRYTVRLGKDGAGKSIIPNNGVGQYVIYYEARLNVRDKHLNDTIDVTNDAVIKVFTGSSSLPDITEPDKTTHKTSIKTKVVRENVIVQ